MPLKKTALKNWKLLAKKDVSPSSWFPIESRSYQLPDGSIVEDFTITTLTDVSMVVPITKQGQVVLVRQFKPGWGEVMIQFPAGRIEPNHQDFVDTAVHELEEETGIKVKPTQLSEFAVLSGFPTKGTERVHFFLAKDCEFNSQQNLDPNEDIEVLEISPSQLDQQIFNGQIQDAQTIAGWVIAKEKFPDITS